MESKLLNCVPSNLLHALYHIIPAEKDTGNGIEIINGMYSPTNNTRLLCRTEMAER